MSGSLAQPAGRETISDHRLHVAAMDVGNMGAQVKAYRAFCSCGHVGERNEDEDLVLRRWRDHASGCGA